MIHTRLRFEVDSTISTFRQLLGCMKGIWKKQNFFGTERQMWSRNYDHFEWSRTSRKCQIQLQREYELYLLPPVFGGLGCTFQPLAE
jgi:hypothetical protein